MSKHPQVRSARRGPKDLFAKGRALQFSNLLWGGVRGGRIVKRDKLAFYTSPIRSLEFERLTIFARHVVPIGETCRATIKVRRQRQSG